MSKEGVPNLRGEAEDLYVWAPVDSAENAHLVFAGAPRRLEVNGAPIAEQSHEYVMRKPIEDA